jgi:hypothetical protein
MLNSTKSDDRYLKTLLVFTDRWNKDQWRRAISRTQGEALQIRLKGPIQI